MKSIAVFIFAFALIPFAKGQMNLSVENLYMLEAAVIGTGGFLLSLEPMRKPIVGSFLRNILTQAVAAGMLVSVGILLPLLLYTIPPFFGAEPIINGANVRTMMTILVTLAGLVVLFSMCLPFNKYRLITLTALVGVATFLGLMLPTSYLGGLAVGPDMLAFDKAAGQTIFDSQLMQEMFKPGNAAVVKNLIADRDNFVILRLFLYVAVPMFILIRFAIENANRKNYGKDVKKNRSFRIGRRFTLASGIVLILYAVLSAVEMIASASAPVPISERYHIGTGLSVFINIVYILLHLAIGYIGYKTWKDPTKKMLRVVFAAAIVLTVVTVGSMILSNSMITRTNDMLMIIDSILVLVSTAAYITGAVIVRSQYKLGLLKPRDA